MGLPSHVHLFRECFQLHEQFGGRLPTDTGTQKMQFQSFIKRMREIRCVFDGRQ